MTPADEVMEEDLPLEVEVGSDTEVEVIPDPEPPAHKDNLAEFLEDEDLQKIADDLLEYFEEDENSRSEWLRQYTDGLDLLGFSMEDRDRPFKGASGVYHPVLTEAVVRFQSNAIMEIFPASGPVLTKILGDDTPEKFQQSIRVKEELNYQLTENMSEFRSETEQLLFRLPLAGSVFKKTYYDGMTKKPCSNMIPAEDMVVPYSATHIDHAERITQIMRLSKNKLLKMMRAGLYRKVDLQSPVAYTSEGKEKEDELKGTEKLTDKDERYTVLEFHVHFNLPPPFDDPDDIADPYIITVDKSSRAVLGIYRNWEEADQDRKPECYFTHYFYMPGFGFYGIGLIHLMGAISKASTSILRQLIDAGTLSNLPGGLKTRGLRTKGGEDPIAPGEWRDVDVPAGSLKDNIMPLPYKEPSAVLAALLQNLIEEGRRIGSIADVDIGSGSENAPVGTTLALMERSLKVMSAVHARLHASLKKELRLIAKVIAEYMPPQYDWDTEQKFDRSQDFDGRVDIVPVSDPNAATQAQRIVQMQAVMQLAQTAPELYNMKELHRAGLQAIGIKNDDRILPYDQEPPRMDPVQENMSILTGQPVKVYPDQDHQAHITAHMAAIMDPQIMQMIGQSPNAVKIQAQMEAHLAEHLANQYRQEIQEQMGVELPPMGEPLPPEIENRLARLVAQAAERLRKKHEAEAQEAKNQQIAEDPVFQLRVKELQIKEKALEHQMAKDAADDMLDMAKAVSKEALDIRRIESEEARAGAKIGADLVTFGAQLSAEDRRSGIQLGKEVLSELNNDAKEWSARLDSASMTRQQMLHEKEENERDRQHALEVEKIKGRKKPTTSGGNGD
jgi:hypothetical protein